MNKYLLAMIFVCPIIALTSCSNREQNTISPISTKLVYTQSLTPIISINDYQNRVLVGENDAYSIYLINRSGGTDAAPTGELLVNKKNNNQVIKMNGQFTVIVSGGTIIFDDGMDKYILLSIGTYTSRKGIVLSIDSENQAGNDICMTSGPNGDHLFWNDTIIFNNCDTFPNRPWGMGEAPSIVGMELITGRESTIVKSDLKHHYQVKQIEGNNLRYFEIFVEHDDEWSNSEKQKSEERLYNLLLLDDKR
jgi:hypothetical protein